MDKTYRVYREASGDVRADVDGEALRHTVVHSPTGFETGYGGSGPADLALSILADFFHETQSKPNTDRGIERAWRWHQKFKWEFIANQQLEPGHEYIITALAINAWLASQEER